MVIASSAVLAILLKESEAEMFVAAMEGDEVRVMYAATLLEAAIALEGRSGREAGRDLDLFLRRAGVEIAAVDEGQAEIARAA